MSSMQQKITRHTKKQESVIHSKEKNKSTVNVHEETCVSDLLDKDFENNCLKDAQKAKGRYGQARKWSMHNMCNNKEVSFKKSQTEILELKGTITEAKNSLEGFENRCTQAG